MADTGLSLADSGLGQAMRALTRKGDRLQRKKSWTQYLKKIGDDFSRIEKNTTLKDLIRREGIPPEHRGKLWIHLTGVKEKASSDVLTYQDLVETFADQESEHTIQIDKDLNRTFTDGEAEDHEETIQALRRVLVSYSWLNPEIGYCQSMNFITALFLLFMDEEEAFWLLKTTVEDILPQDYYTRSMRGVRVDEFVLMDLLQQKLPKIHAHIEEIGMPLSSVVTPWFMCLFINILSLECTLRFFDSLFVEGSKMIFRMALALFKVNSKAILATTEFDELFMLLKNFGDTSDAGVVMEAAFNKDWMGSMPGGKIQSLRQQYHNELSKSAMEESMRWEKKKEEEVVTSVAAPVISEPVHAAPPPPSPAPPTPAQDDSCIQRRSKGTLCQTDSALTGSFRTHMDLPDDRKRSQSALPPVRRPPPARAPFKPKPGTASPAHSPHPPRFGGGGCDSPGAGSLTPGTSPGLAPTSPGMRGRGRRGRGRGVRGRGRGGVRGGVVVDDGAAPASPGSSPATSLGGSGPVRGARSGKPLARGGSTGNLQKLAEGQQLAVGSPVRRGRGAGGAGTGGPRAAKKEVDGDGRLPQRPPRVDRSPQVPRRAGRTETSATSGLLAESEAPAPHATLGAAGGAGGGGGLARRPGNADLIGGEQDSIAELDTRFQSRFRPLSIFVANRRRTNELFAKPRRMGKRFAPEELGQLRS